MKLTKLFEMQKVLDDRIVKEKGLEGVDLLPNKILALQVELGELANEWRGFKFWSDDREPRTKAYPKGTCTCKDCDGYWCDKLHEATAEAKGIYVNPLLEEYVDCLHFILSIGLELYPDNDDLQIIAEDVRPHTRIDIIDQFQACFYHTSRLLSGSYTDLFECFLGLGKLLDFTWDEIEQAYFSKNAVNHARQDGGY